MNQDERKFKLWYIPLLIIGVFLLVMGLIGCWHFFGHPDWIAGAWFVVEETEEPVVEPPVVEETEEPVVEPPVVEETEEPVVEDAEAIFKLAALNQVSGYSIVAVYPCDGECIGTRYNTEVDEAFLKDIFPNVPDELFVLNLDWEIEYYPSIPEAELIALTSLENLEEKGSFNDDVMIFNINPDSMDIELFDALNDSTLMQVFVPRLMDTDWCSVTEFVEANDLDVGGEYYTLYIDLSGQRRWNPCICQ